MNYAKIVNGTLIDAPRNLKLEDGRIIFNFHYDVEVMKEYGFKPVQKNIPEFNPLTEIILVNGFEDKGEFIVVNYTVKTK